MSRITKMTLCFQRIAGLTAVMASFLLAGCACHGIAGAGIPAPPAFAMSALIPGPAPEGVTISRSGFDGGAFSAVLPVRAQDEDLSPAQALEQIAPVLRAIGFLRGLSELAGPDQPLRLEPPDLKSLAAEVCREAALQQSSTSRDVCAALSGEGPPSPLAEQAIRDAYGLSLAEWKGDLERLSFQYPFSQLVGGVPIESAGVTAYRRQGESLSLLQGSLFDRFVIANRVDPRRRDAVLTIARTLLAGQSKDSPVPIGVPDLVLIPYGTARTSGGETVPALRYAWRVLLGRQDGPQSWMAWVDAANGDLLREAAQWNDATEVPGVRWRRDPGLCKPTAQPCTQSVKFEVDPLPDGKLALQLNGVFLQVEKAYGPKLEIDPGREGFDRSPINRNETAVCGSQGNDAFRQVNAYSHLYSLWKIIASVGTVPKFPEKPLRVVVDDPDPGDKKGSAAYYDNRPGDALSSLWLADGHGFREAKCPALPGYRLNGAQDVTVLAHETSHLLVQRLQERRPARWCGCAQCASCPLPDALGHNILHDFADSFAFSYASTNCFAGWSAKNLDGENANLYCQGQTSEAGWFPRLAQVSKDRFPEHRRIHEGEYANGQIAAAGLWEIRKGIRSKALVAGTEEYWVRLLRSLGGFGFMNNTCSKYTTDSATHRKSYTSCDRDVFLYLQDLERRMVGEWSTAGKSGQQMVSKILSGWAKAGLYLTPFTCLDGDPATADPVACPDNPSKPETAPDAVIEIDDQDTSLADDIKVDEVVHPEVDYLSRTGRPPRFLVWTGPHYRFSKAGIAVMTAPPCGVRYEVEVAADAAFLQKKWTSGVKPVPPSQPCQADVELEKRSWDDLSKGERLYYRVRTWDVLGRERISTSPGAGAFRIDPPFAVINATGKP
jgi:hypothetical protein